MLRLLERDPHGQRLRDLLGHFRAQEVALAAAVDQRLAELELAQAAASAPLPRTPGEQRRLIARCIELQAESDGLAIELVHARMAVVGTEEELLEHDLRRVDASLETATASSA